MDALPHWQNDPCSNVSPTLVAGAEKFHTHVEENGDVLVCSTTGSRLYRWINDLGIRRVGSNVNSDALPGELLAVSDLFPLAFG